MGVLVYVLGRSGTGKSYSMRNFKAGEIGVINVQGKILPFKGSGALDVVNTDNSGEIVKAIELMAKKYKVIVVDDFQYVMANEFMRRATERGYDKFTDIARHAWDIANAVQALPADVIVYVMCHTDTDADGFEKLKTIGKLLDEKIVLEGMSTIVLKTNVTDGEYMFLTQNSGKDTVKSPAGMFPSYAIDNDLKYVDTKIRNYYEIGDYANDAEVEKMDAQAEKEDVQKPDSDGRKRRRKEADASEQHTEEQVVEQPKKRGRKPRNTAPIETSAEAEKPQETAENKSLSDEEINKRMDEGDFKSLADALPSESAVSDAPVEAVEHKRRRRRKSNTLTQEDLNDPVLDINDDKQPF